MKEFKNKGVYALVNTITNDMYIGSSINIGCRIEKHFSWLRNNKHLNCSLQESVNKHSIKAFKVFVLEFTDDLVNKEQYYVDLHKPTLNITIEIINNTPSTISRERMSKTRLQMYKDSLQPNCAKSVVGINLETGEVVNYNTIKEAYTIHNIDRSAMQRTLRGIFKQMKGYKWYYKEEYDLLKLGELLENPVEDNQQPNTDLNAQ